MKNRIPDNTFVKFAIVGVLHTLAGTAIMFGLYNIAGASYWVSSAANYILASILSYVLNKKFTFRHEGEVLQSGLRFAVNIAVCYFVAYGAAKPADRDRKSRQHPPRSGSSAGKDAVYPRISLP